MENYQNKSKEELIQIIESLQKSLNKHEHLSEINMQTILSSVNDLVFVFDTEQRFTFVNIPENQKLLIKADKFIGQKYREVMPVEMHQKFEEAFEKNKQAKFSTYDYQLEYKNEQFFYTARLSPIFKDKNFHGGVAIVSDISDRIKAENELKAQKNKMQSIFRSAPIGIGIVSNRIITHINDRFCEICGYSSDELINRSAEIVYPTKEEYERVGQEKYKQIKKNGTGTVETKFKRKDGRIIDVLLSSTPIDFEDLNKGITFTALDISEIKKAEKNLILNERKFRLLADHTYDWEYWINPNSEYVYLSPACERITGYRPDEFKSNPNLLYNMVHPDYKEKVHTHYQDENNLDTPVYTTEFLIINKAGKEIWINHHCSPIFDDDGKFLGRRGNNRDITKAKIAEKKLFESESKFKNVFENSLVGFTVTGIDGSLDINEAFADILGYTSEELHSQNWAEITHPDDIDESNTVVKSLLDNKVKNAKFEKRYIHKKGHTIYVIMNVFLQRDASGKPEYFIGAIIDITDKIKAEEELIASEKLLQTLINTVPDLIFMKDGDGVYLTCNHRFENFYGAPLNEIKGKTDYDFVEKELADFFRKNDKEAITAGKPTKNEEEVIFANDGHHEILKTIKTPLYDSENKLIGVLGVSRDITQHKQIIKELEESEFKFRSFFENNQAMMLEIDPKTKNIVSCNNKALDFYGYEKEEILNKQIYDINIMGKNEIDKKMASALQQASHFSRFQHKLSDQTIRDVDVYASPVKVGEKKHMFILIIDITDNLKNEKELEVYRKHLEETVKERTRDLEEKNKKLEDYNELFIGREFRIKELREEIKALKANL